MKEFKLLKNEILEKAHKEGACGSGCKEVQDTTNHSDLLKVIVKHLDWCVGHKILTAITVEADFGKDLMVEHGIWNPGADNVGFSNTGNWNTGDSNTGDSNTGNWNTGDSNTGDRNTGDSNTGDRNTGDSNTGNWNTGDSNTGDSNTGNWNTGYSNTGYSNTGNWNTGAFCTGEKTIKLFNKDSDWTDEQFRNSKAWNLLCEVDTKLWIPDSKMTDEEKANHKGWKNAEGFFRDIPFKAAFQDKWNNWSETNRKAFTSLPNFNAEIFEEITGVKI